jgi:hypothetical protein
MSPSKPSPPCWISWKSTNLGWKFIMEDTQADVQTGVLLSLSFTFERKVAKQSRYTPWWHLGERRYSSYSFLTSALDGGEWSTSRPERKVG